jgi:SAM-dependent methyltransferase
MSNKSHSLEGRLLFESLLPDCSKIIDIGSGPNEIHANYFRNIGHTVDVCDFHKSAKYQGNFNDIKILEKYDAVWSSHCLEHQLNVNVYLKNIHNVLKEEGWLCITVPPLKHSIVGGHVSLWNAGLILFNLVAAGFNCRNAKIKTYRYNISVIVKKQSIDPLPSIKEIQILNNIREYFPLDIGWVEKKYGRFNGQIEELNWNTE